MRINKKEEVAFAGKNECIRTRIKVLREHGNKEGVGVKGGEHNDKGMMMMTMMMMFFVVAGLGMGKDKDGEMHL